MKIVQVSTHYPPSIGGAQQRIRDLSERLAKRGHDVEVFTSDDGFENKEIKPAKNEKVNVLKSFSIFNTPIALSLGSKLAKIPKSSIMHIHVVQAFFPEISSRTARINNIPYIAHIRGDLPPSGKFGKILLPIYKKLILKKIFRNASRVIALNEDYKNIFAKKYNLDIEKIIVIPNATDFKIISKDNIDVKKLKRIMFVGRLTSEKNIDSIIKALSIMQNKDIIFYIAGDGKDISRLIKLVKEKNLEKQVIFMGKIDRRELYKEYIKSDLVILPSKVECFSSVLLEAMATGTPIIASDIPGTRSVIKNNYNGILVKPIPEEIAKSIQELTDKPKLRRNLAENGLREVKKYSWDRIVEQTEAIYREVLKEHENNKK